MAGVSGDLHEKKIKLTSNIEIDTGNPIVIYEQSTQTVKVRQVFQFDNFVVRQVNSIKLILLKTEKKK